MINLRNLQLQETESLMESLGEAKFRGKQVFGWIYKNVQTFDEMVNVPVSLREKLRTCAQIGHLNILKVQTSKLDGTRKYLFELEDGRAIESVFMKYKFGNSICVSSQAGCRMGCKFCASTIGGFERNLTAGEIVAQILEAEKDTGEPINHVVIMGTGEPFDNYDNIAKFIRIVNDKSGLNLGMRNITVSTCGIVPMIGKFAEDFPQVNLAISLHAVDDRMRNNIMPVNKAYPMEQLITACRDYTRITSRRITFEYTLVKDFNDSRENAEKLATLLGGMLCHVNLIPLNKVRETGLDTSSRKSAENFRNILENRGIPATIRRELGDDIDAACGQLRLTGKKS